MIDEQSATIVVLGAWEALVCVVPPSASYRFQRKLTLPAKPTRPMATYPTITGVDETVEALPETKEYNAWLAEMEIWTEERDRAETENAIYGSEFAYDYALLAWRRLGEKVWLEQPPEDWQLPGAYARHDVEVSDNMRLEFIVNVLLNTDERLVAAREVMYPARLGTERDTSPIKREEVVAAVASFPAGDAVSGATGRVGASAGEGAKREREDEQPRSRVTGGRSKSNKSGFMARLFSRRKNIDAGVGSD